MKGDICKKKNKIEQDRQSFTSCLRMCFPENRLTPIVSIHVMKMEKKITEKESNYTQNYEFCSFTVYPNNVSQ